MPATPDTRLEGLHLVGVRVRVRVGIRVRARVGVRVRARVGVRVRARVGVRDRVSPTPHGASPCWRC